MLSTGQKRQRKKEDDDEDTFPFETPNPFNKPWQNSDVVLIVEEQELHAHLTFLGFASPVFKRMFESTFKEGKTKTVEMKEKSYEAVVNVLKLIYPQFTVNVEKLPMTTLESICDMVKEYMMKPLLNKIETALVTNLGKMLEEGGRGYMEKKYPLSAMTQLADKHHFHDLMSECANSVIKYRETNLGGSLYELSDKAKTKCIANYIIHELEGIKNLEKTKYDKVWQYKFDVDSRISLIIERHLEPMRKRDFLRDTRRIDE